MSEAASAEHDAAIDKLIGEVLASRYQIESLLGEGAMGTVYKARHVKVGRPFAVKVLHKKLLEDKKVAQRFEREAELAGRLRHPNVIGVVDVGETSEGTRYMVMDFAEGDDLASLLAEAPMPPERIIHLCRQILEGLFHAHEAGLIHRDLKPENIIVERDDHDRETPRIVDFGIAILRDGGDSAGADGRLTTNGLVLGTPHYMAPEQAVADPIDHRIDLFALGIVIYEMLCGKLPFDGTGAEVARANLLLDPPSIATRVPYLEVDPLLEAFARLLMQKKREERPTNAKTARELLDLIENDRVAAAERLGVPLELVRTTATTQQSAPLSETMDRGSPDLAIAQQNGDFSLGAIPGSKRAPTPLPLPGVDPPRARTPAAGVPTAASAPRHHSTESAAPLRFSEREIGVAPPRSRRMLGIGIGAALVALIAIVGIAVVGGSTAEKKAKTTDDTIAMQPSPSATNPTPTEVAPTPTEIAPTPTEIAPTPTEVGSAAVVAPPPDEGSATEEIAMDPVPATTPGGGKTPKPNGKTPKPNGKTPTEVATPAGTGSAATVPTATEQVATTALTAKSVTDHYRRVGAAIAKLQKSSGDDAAADLWTRYRRIQIQKATSTPAEMTSADRELTKIEKLATK